MRALVVSSGATNPADAVIEVGVRLRARGFDRHKTASALVYASVPLAKDPVALSQALADLLDPVPFLGFVGASAYAGADLPERSPGLVVIVLEGVRGAVRTAPLSGSAGDVAGTLLADAPIGRARFLALAADAATPGTSRDILPALDGEQHHGEHGGTVVGSVCVAPAGQRPSILAKGAGVGPSAGLLTLDDVSVICCVAQGARSIGPLRAITRVKDNLIVELDGRPAIEALMRDLPPSLQNQLPRLAGSLFVGFPASDDTPLMRAVVGLDPHTGGVAVTDLPREGNGVTFALRDPRSARIDTEEAVESLAMALHGPDPPLLLTVHNSVARDKNLFEAPLWDINRVRAHLPNVPVVGGSGAGEICTWGSGTFLFGMSAVVAALVPSH